MRHTPVIMKITTQMGGINNKKTLYMLLWKKGAELVGKGTHFRQGDQKIAL